jgi:hypothetical protein
LNDTNQLNDWGVAKKNAKYYSGLIISSVLNQWWNDSTWIILCVFCFFCFPPSIF